MQQKIKNIYIEILLQLLLWVAIFYVVNSVTTIAENFEQNFNGVVIFKIIVRSVFPLSLLTMALMLLVFYSNIFWLLENTFRWKSLLVRLLAVFGWTVLLFFADYFIVSAFLPHNGIRQIEWRRLQVGIFLIFLFVMGLSFAWFFVKEWYRHEVLRKQSEANQLATEIKFLKSQVHPHFLFNTLNNLFSMAQQKENLELADSILKLSGMMRYMIYESNAERVPLKKEIEYLQNFIVLNKLRFDDKEAMVNFNYPVNMQGITIAPMIFIPFVENAFKHGIEISKPSQINISISVHDAQIWFTCENANSSYIKKMNDQSSGVGLKNIKRRLKLLYPGRHKLETNDEENKYHVQLKINLK